ncbi:GTPase [Achromobacter aegrifaciens]
MSTPRMDTPQLQDAIADAISTATRGAGRVNILVAGKTGVGKSTLINAVFRGDLAKTGAGKPVTQSTQEFTRAGHPLTIIDTRGLEVGDYERSRQQLADLIRERSASDDQDRHLHVAWLCIQDSSHRVEDAEIELCDMLSNAGIPVVAVLTKARKNSPFVDEARKLLPRAKQVVAVRALPEWIEELDAELPPMGLDNLIEATALHIPEAQQRAYANALSTRNKKALEVKKKRAEIEVNVAAGLAASAAAAPIPFSDAFALVPIQVGMIAKIGITFGMELDTTAITTLVTSTLGASAATLIGRSVVSGLLKFIPGAGSAVGGAIAATTAGTITKLLGNAYVAVLHDFCLKNPGKDIDIAMIAKGLKQRVSF